MKLVKSILPRPSINSLWSVEVPHILCYAVDITLLFVQIECLAYISDSFND